MYLSKYRLKLNWGNRITLNDVLNGQALHRSIQSLFGSTRAEKNVLYMRNFVSADKAFVYVYSSEMPLEESDHFERLFCREQKEIYIPGSMLRFRIVCSPMKQRDGHRYFLRSAEDRKEWFLRQAIKHGFECLSLSEVGKENITVQKNAKNIFTLTIVTFSGVLRVVDSDAFANALRCGIGAEKAYGSGMLLVV